jgi:hypothetical protein
MFRMGVGLRWQIPSHLLDAVFTCVGLPVLADIADSKEASKLELYLVNSSSHVVTLEFHSCRGNIRRLTGGC